METTVLDLLNLKYNQPDRLDIIYAPDTVERYHVPYFTIDNIIGLENIPLFKYYNLNDQARMMAILKTDHNILALVALFYDNRPKFCQLISRLTNFVRLFSLDIIKDKLTDNIVRDMEHFIFESSCQVQNQSDTIDLQFWKDMMDDNKMAKVLFWSYYRYEDKGEVARSTDVDEGVEFWNDNKKAIYSHFNITTPVKPDVSLLYLTLASIYQKDEVLKNIYLAVQDQKNTGIYLAKVQSLLDINEALTPKGSWSEDTVDTHLVAHHIFNQKFDNTVIDMANYTIKIRDKLYYNYNTKLYTYTFEADGNHVGILYKMAMLVLMRKNINELLTIIYSMVDVSIPPLSKPDLIYLILFLLIPDSSDIQQKVDNFLNSNAQQKYDYLNSEKQNIKNYEPILTYQGPSWTTGPLISDEKQPVPYSALDNDIVIKFGSLQLTIPKVVPPIFPSILDYQGHFNINNDKSDQIYKFILDLYIHLHITEDKVYNKFIDGLEKL